MQSEKVGRVAAFVELLAITPDAERLIERAARTCYRSYDCMRPGSAAALIKHLIRMGHESVLEHASATFRIGGVSRALTHQLVRHRLASYSQQSQRYVEVGGLDYVMPPVIAANEEAKARYQQAMEDLACLYEELRQLGVPKEDARFVLPNAAATEIVVTANMREWRHIITLRCQQAAQWEIRGVCLKVLRILKRELPTVFYDFDIDEDNQAVVKQGE